MAREKADILKDINNGLKTLMDQAREELDPKDEEYKEVEKAQANFLLKADLRLIKKAQNNLIEPLYKDYGQAHTLRPLALLLWLSKNNHEVIDAFLRSEIRKRGLEDDDNYDEDYGEGFFTELEDWLANCIERVFHKVEAERDGTKKKGKKAKKPNLEEDSDETLNLPSRDYFDEEDKQNKGNL